MSSADGDASGPRSADNRVDDPDSPVDVLLTEALIHLLVEKGVLTRNDALSVVETVAQVRLGSLHERAEPRADHDPTLRKLRRMYASFEALDGRPDVVETDAENVVRLRPPIYGDRHEFPRDD
jgi:hypothetical protein